MGGEVCLRCKGKTLLVGQQTFENNKFVDITQQCFALLSQVNFPTNNSNFQIQAIFLNLFYFKVRMSYLLFDAEVAEKLLHDL